MSDQDDSDDDGTRLSLDVSLMAFEALSCPQPLVDKGSTKTQEEHQEDLPQPSTAPNRFRGYQSKQEEFKKKLSRKFKFQANPSLSDSTSKWTMNHALKLGLEHKSESDLQKLFQLSPDESLLEKSREFCEGLEDLVPETQDDSFQASDPDTSTSRIEQIYDNEDIWDAFTRDQFAYVSRVFSIQDGDEERVDDLIHFLLLTLGFVSPPELLKTLASTKPGIGSNDQKDTITQAEESARCGARDFFRQYKATGVSTSKFDLIGFVFGQYSLIHEPWICYLFENKKPGEGHQQSSVPQYFGEMLNAALSNMIAFDLQSSEKKISSFPIFLYVVSGTLLSIYYANFSRQYLTEVRTGEEPKCHVELISYAPIFPLPIMKLDFAGTLPERERAFEALGYLLAWTKKQSGFQGVFFT